MFLHTEIVLESLPMSFNSFRFTDKTMEVTMVTECTNILLSLLLLAHTYYSFRYMLCSPM